RKNTVQNTVPVLVALKRLLEAARSPLLGPLMRYLVVLAKEQKGSADGACAAPLRLALTLLALTLLLRWLPQSCSPVTGSWRRR
ncbi:MAG: hypothetical protein ACK4ZJ_18115, partial [Allorhizobium sp.]